MVSGLAMNRPSSEACRGWLGGWLAGRFISYCAACCADGVYFHNRESQSVISTQCPPICVNRIIEAEHLLRRLLRHLFHRLFHRLLRRLLRLRLLA